MSAAITAARAWRYKPVVVDGQTRAVFFVVRVPFRKAPR